jgi:two-component system CheB/CheR fusion protein
VILSGTGSGGSQRLQAVKAAGRFALVRESTGARFPGMPDAALATGLVDFILPVDKIARRLDEMAHHRQSIRSEDAQARIQGKVEAAVPRIAKALARVGATTSPSTSPARRSGGSRGG